MQRISDYSDFIRSLILSDLIRSDQIPKKINPESDLIRFFLLTFKSKIRSDPIFSKIWESEIRFDPIQVMSKSEIWSDPIISRKKSEIRSDLIFLPIFEIRHQTRSEKRRFSKIRHPIRSGIYCSDFELQINPKSAPILLQSCVVSNYTYLRQLILHSVLLYNKCL